MRVEQKKIIVRAIGDRVHDTMLACSCSMPSPVLLDVLCVRERLSERERERPERSTYVQKVSFLLARTSAAGRQLRSGGEVGTGRWQRALQFAPFCYAEKKKEG